MKKKYIIKANTIQEVLVALESEIITAMNRKEYKGSSKLSVAYDYLVAAENELNEINL